MNPHAKGLLRSLGIALAAGAASFLAAWGFFNVHEEAGVSPETAWSIGAIVAGSVFLGSVIAHFAKWAGRH